MTRYFNKTKNWIRKKREDNIRKIRKKKKRKLKKRLSEVLDNEIITKY